MAQEQGRNIMKRYGELWERLVGWDNLLLAARKAQRGKRNKHSVQAFNFDQERNLLRLQRELEERNQAIRKLEDRMGHLEKERDTVRTRLQKLLEQVDLLTTEKSGA